jgi:DsbC/DsbD-like thiol-disulfide interchange protein
MQRALVTVIAGVVSCVGLLCGAPTIEAQPPASGGTQYIEVKTSAAKPTLTPGTRATLFVDVTPKPSMHVYAPGEKDAIPVTVTLTPTDALKADAPSFPKPEQFYFAPIKLTQLIYSKPFRITVPVTVAKTASGTLDIKGTIRYQACDDKVCYTPKTIPLAWSLAVR